VFLADKPQYPFRHSIGSNCEGVECPGFEASIVKYEGLGCNRVHTLMSSWPGNLTFAWGPSTKDIPHDNSNSIVGFIHMKPRQLEFVYLIIRAVYKYLDQRKSMIFHETFATIK
jgi:hypothetical protein